MLVITIVNDDVDDTKAHQQSPALSCNNLSCFLLSSRERGGRECRECSARRS
jgi:hypothetical protein